MKNTADLNGIGHEIEETLKAYLAVNSETCTNRERDGESFLMSRLDAVSYFREHKELRGSYPVQDDPLGRAVCWALVRGEGPDTVLLLHHYDVVGIEDFKSLKEYAFSPDLLEEQLKIISARLTKEAETDLLSGDYLFGRGSADMKAGGAIQLALLKRYSEIAGMAGNVLLIALPDEENLSAGMRAASGLLLELKEKYGLRYQFAFNSEPHQRKNNDVGLISEGSVGKTLAFVYVRGFLAHVGKAFEGLNPVSVISELVSETELCSAFSDHAFGEASPPPTWLYLRDRKESYDVSMPLGAGGCISILTLDSHPAGVLEKLAGITEASFDTVIDRMNERYSEFCKSTGKKPEKLPWKPSVVTFAELLEEACRNYGKEFLVSYQSILAGINDRIRNGETDFIEGSFLLTEHVFNFIDELSPRAVVGLVPPYYPNVCNHLLVSLNERQKTLADLILDYSESFGKRYEREAYYTGISDLSYLSLKGSGKIKAELEKNMPLYGRSYAIPLETVEALSMPSMNIGPWGKDFHKLTERVYKPDLYSRTPAMLNRAVGLVLGWL